MTIYIFYIFFIFVLGFSMFFLSNKISLIDRPSERKIHEGNVPLIGGLTGGISILVFSFFLIHDDTLSFIIQAAMVILIIGLIDDSGWDGMDLIGQIRHIYDIQGFKTEILAASIRNALHITKAAELGADVCTCPLDSILGLLKHPLTDIGLAKFLEDAKKM